jgi:hypothetical protein
MPIRLPSNVLVPSIVSVVGKIIAQISDENAPDD